MTTGLLFLLVGPSGTGKTTLIKRALAGFPDLQRYITYTTRPPRPDEIHGRDYYFVSDAEFERMRARGEFAECQEFYQHKYGTARAEIERRIHKGIDSIASTDVLGAAELQKQYPQNVVTIFVLPPSVEAARERLEKRGGDISADDLVRLARFDMEMSYAGAFRYALVNANLEEAVRNVESIIRAERCARLARQIREQAGTANTP